MSDAIDKALLFGLGLASLTKDGIQKRVDKLVEQSKITEAEGRKMAKELQGRSKEVRMALENKIDAVVHKLFEHLDLSEIIAERLKDSKPAPKSTKKAKTTKTAKTAKKARRPSASKSGSR